MGFTKCYRSFNCIQHQTDDGNSPFSEKRDTSKGKDAPTSFFMLNSGMALVKNLVHVDIKRS